MERLWVVRHGRTGKLAVASVSRRRAVVDLMVEVRVPSLCLAAVAKLFVTGAELLRERVDFAVDSQTIEPATVVVCWRRPLAKLVLVIGLSRSWPG